MEQNKIKKNSNIFNLILVIAGAVIFLALPIIPNFIGILLVIIGLLRIFWFGSPSDRSKKLLIWIVWLILVCVWNFGWPSVPPIADVVVAVILSIAALQSTKYWK